MKAHYLICAALAIFTGATAFAQHSHDDGAPAVVHAGVVAFENSGAAAAQKDFLLGLALLHNFQYPSAAAAFQRAEKTDPGFAMAYWGEAMTYNHPVWHEQDANAARAALAKLGATREERLKKAPTPRERAYLQAVEILYGDGDKYDRDRRYSLAMEALHAKFPDDIDGTCFYALSLLGTAHAGRDVPTYMRSAALMEDLFERYPEHPGAAHYLIHSVDDAAHAPLGLRAANAYAKIAPDSPHAQHMTSHIYLALGMWQETALANETSIAVAARNMRAADPNRALPGCGHAQTWLAYAYLQQGRFNSARRQLNACAQEVGQRPKTASGANALDYDSTSVASFEEMRARQLIDGNEWRGPASKLAVDTANNLTADYTRDFADAYGAARFGEPDAAQKALQRVETSTERLLAEVNEAGLPAEHPWRRIPSIELEELRGLIALKRGDSVQAVKRLSAAAARERELPMDFGPPSLHKPANELLGDVLLELNQPADARAAFEDAQRLAPGKTASLQGLARCADALKDTELSASVNAKLAHIRQTASPDTE